jgi:hypothetical protein
MKSLKISALVLVCSVLVLWTGNVFAQGNDPLVDEVAILGSGSSNPQSSSELQASSNSEWKDVTTTDGTTPSTCAETPDNCSMQDPVRGLIWSQILRRELNWFEALDACAALTHNGKEAGSWRLPADRELLAAYRNGIKDAASGDWISKSGLNDWFWSASFNSYEPISKYAQVVDLQYGNQFGNNKYANLPVICVQ